MKPTAFFINTSRGPVVDEAALVATLEAKKIAGAGLDVFETEPVDPDDPILKLDNILVTPHALCWTDECFRGIGRSACAGILEVSAGRVPPHVVNREVEGQPLLAEKLRRIRSRRARA